MRALCGAIITAGALVGLGLTALGYGIRYQTFGLDKVNPDTHNLYGAPSLMIALVVLLAATAIGLGIAFLGLAFHHERRYRELLRESGRADSTRVPV
jgi:putative Mn2+ efflux pump MntP